MKNVSFGAGDIIKLVAHSKAGASPPVYIRGNNFSSRTEESSGGTFLIWSLVGIGVGLLVFLVIWRLLPRRLRSEQVRI